MIKQCDSVLGGKVEDFGVRCEKRLGHTDEHEHEPSGAVWLTRLVLRKKIVNGTGVASVLSER